MSNPTVTPDPPPAYVHAYILLMDLDRCEHGRHSIDHCLMCPGGQSTGNLCLTPGTLIGHTVHGLPIVVPADTEERTNPRHWIARPS